MSGISPWKFSENNKFAIHNNLQDILFIHSTVDKTNLHPWIVKTKVKPVKKGYDIYNINKEFTSEQNDCLNFAESLTSKSWGYNKIACALKERKTNKVFGSSDEKNIILASDSENILNDTANPDVGEVYAIVRKKIIMNKAPYHIAYVVAKDGNTSITIEADAGDPQRKIPIFDMYTVGSSTYSFHSRYKDDFKPASTILLIKK